MNNNGKPTEFSFIPLNRNKVPVIPKLEPWFKELTPEDLWKPHVEAGGNLGIVTGHELYNLEVIDVDCKYDLTGDLWTNLKAKIPKDLFSKLAIQQTVKKGYHLFYFRQSRPTTNRVLAKRENHTRKSKTKNPKENFHPLIETRGTRRICCSFPVKRL